MGLGRHLMRRLVRWARGKKLERMYGDVLESNQPMLSLADSLGFRREASDTPGLVRVVLDLATADGRHAVSGDGARLRSPGYAGGSGGRVCRLSGEGPELPGAPHAPRQPPPQLLPPSCPQRTARGPDRH